MLTKSQPFESATLCGYEMLIVDVKCSALEAHELNVFAAHTEFISPLKRMQRVKQTVLAICVNEH
jgi:hypothetical protein